MTGLQAFRETLMPHQLALIQTGVGRQYLTGFRSSDGILLVWRDRAVLYLDSRYFEMACIAKDQGKIPSEVEIRPATFAKEFEELSRSGKAKEVLFEDRHVSVSQLANLRERYPKSEFLPLNDTLDRIRVVKSEAEIEKIRQAQKLAEEAYLYILPRLEKGRTELAVAAELEYYMKLHGASGASFETICAGGTRSSLPHGRAEDIPLGEGFLTMDFGCLLDGWASDMTRTVCIGKAGDEMKKVYQTVLEANRKAIAAVRAGVLGSAVDRAAREHIAGEGYGEYFGHSTGHGIGLEVHEAPSFSSRYDRPIPERAVLSVEPGIYLPGRFGVRIEDLVVVREGGSENLNHTEKELLEL